MARFQQFGQKSQDNAGIPECVIDSDLQVFLALYRNQASSLLRTLTSAIPEKKLMLQI